jgi:hypothetical protein
MRVTLHIATPFRDNFRARASIQPRPPHADGGSTQNGASSHRPTVKRGKEYATPGQNSAADRRGGGDQGGVDGLRRRGGASVRARGRARVVLTDIRDDLGERAAASHQQGHGTSLRYLRPFALFASNPCFDPTSKKVITQITQRAANNANSQTLSAVTVSQIEDDPTHLQARAAKVHEKTQVHACRAQIVEALRAMRAAQLCHRFQLDQ